MVKAIKKMETKQKEKICNVCGGNVDTSYEKPYICMECSVKEWG